MSTTQKRDPRVQELERRIKELEAGDEAAFGRFTSWDWALCIAFAVVVPLLAFWRFS